MNAFDRAVQAQQARYDQRMAEMTACTEAERQEEWERMEREDAAEFNDLVDAAIRDTFPQS